MKPVAIGVLLTALVVSSTSAATHVWTGAVSDRFSDSANWTGGSPAGDRDAELLFVSNTGSRTPLNDIDGLTVRAISFSVEGFALGGKAITVTGEVMSTIGDATIACDLVLSGDVTFFVDSSIRNGNPSLRLDGAVRGSGRLIKQGGSQLWMRGPSPNTYTGGTSVRNGALMLEKRSGVTCIPGDLHIAAQVISHLPEQISDDARVTFDPGGRLALGHNETIRALVAIGPGPDDRGSARVTTPGTAALFVRESIEATGNTEVELDRLHLVAPLVVTLQQAGFTATVVGDAPLTIRGDGENLVRLDSTHSSPTLLENVRMSDARLLNSPVTQRGGIFHGRARSLHLDGGTLWGSTIAGELRLSPASLVLLSTTFAAGPVILGGAKLDTSGLQRRELGSVDQVIRTGFGPVIGTFAGLPEGAVINGYTITYRGGDGNDVELRSLAPFPLIEVRDEVIGDKTRLTFNVGWQSVLATGTLTVRRDGKVIGTVQLVNGTGSLDLSLPRGAYEFEAHYAGDAELEAAQTEFEVIVRPPTPVIASIEPDIIRTGSGRVTVTIRGSNFLPDSTVSLAETIEYVSPSELRIVVTSLGKGERERTSEIYVGNSPGPEFSNGMPLKFEAGPPLDPRRLTINADSIVAEVRPGATVAMAMSGYHTWQSERALLTDTDRDGNVTWQFERRARVFVVAVADLETGDSFIEGSWSGRAFDRGPSPQPLAAELYRGPSGAYSNLVMPAMSDPQLLWVRPGAGAWFTDFRGIEAYEQWARGMRFLDAGSLHPVGSSPAAPAAFEVGDILIALDQSNATSFEARVDASMLAPDVPGTLELTDYASMLEYDGALRLLVFRLDGSAGRVSARVTTVDGTARAGLDYVAFDQRVTLEAGEMWKAFEIGILDDALYADWREFNVRLSEPAGATIANAVTEIQIGDNDEPPRVRVDSVTTLEGDGPRSVSTFIHLEGATRIPIEVDWHVGLPGGFGTVVFAPGETRKEIRIPFSGNRTADRDRTLDISLHGGARSSEEDAYLTIVDDDVARISVRDATVVEGNDQHMVELTLDLDIGATRDVQVNWFTRDVTATANVDYTASGGTTIFSSSSTPTAHIEIPILGDLTREEPESFEIVLILPQGGVLARSVARVTIADDDAMPTISISDATGAEGNRISAVLRLSAASSLPVQVTVSTVPGTASNTDYLVFLRGVTIPAGSTSALLDIGLLSDPFAESDETFTIVLTNPVNANLGRSSAAVTIVDDPVSPLIVSVADATVVEGNSGDNTLLVTLSLSAPPPQTVRVGWSTADGTATAGVDYSAAKGEAIFQPRSTTAHVSLVIRGDREIEPDETFRILLASATNATIVRPEAIVTLLDDDGGARRRVAGH